MLMQKTSHLREHWDSSVLLFSIDVAMGDDQQGC